MKHTLESIAKLAGVSRGTVSRVVNGQAGVKEPVREKVQRIIEETGYYPHPQARSLAGGRTENIGVAFFGRHPDVLTHHIFYEVLQSIQTHSAANNYDLLLFGNRGSGDPDYWKRIGTRRKVDGLIIMGEDIQPGYLQYFRQKDIPFVLVGKRVYPGLPLLCVTSEYRKGAYTAVTHLLDRGRRQIAYIQGIPETYHESERFAGYCAALEENGLAFDPSLVLAGQASQEEARRQTEQLLAGGHRFDAVFAGNDLMAFGAIEALTAHGRRVPDDVAVIGYDDIQAAAQWTPPLTTMTQNKERLGREAMTLLLRVLKGERQPDESQDIMIPSELIVRAST